MSEFILRSARFQAAECLSHAVNEGDIVVDATMGNGHDTLFLAQLVGESGHVYAFDIQEQALRNTSELLRRNGMEKRVTLNLRSHADMVACVPFPVRAIMFNFGWLPGGDKTVTTLLSSTMKAVSDALNMLTPHGILCMCVYPGHPEGKRELQYLLNFLEHLNPRQFNCLQQRFLNAGDDAPQCLIVQKQQ